MKRLVTAVLVGVFCLAVVAGAQITEVGDFAFGGNPHDVVIVGDYAIVGGESNTTAYVLDISDVTNPVEVANFSVWPGVYTMHVDGDYLHMASKSGGYRIYDISDITNPVELSVTHLATQVFGVDTDGDFAFIADFSAGIYSYDITDPSNPVEIERQDTDDYSFMPEVVGDHVFLADGFGGLRVMSVDASGYMDEVGHWDNPWPSTVARDVVVRGDYAYLTDTAHGLQVINIVDPTNPFSAGAYDVAGQYYKRVVLNGDYAFIADYQYGLGVLNISDPTNPTLEEQFNIPGGLRLTSVKIYGDYAVCTVRNHGVRIYDVSDYIVPDVLPPTPFSLLSPVDGSRIGQHHGAFFEWEESTDPDALPGESITYEVRIGLNPTFSGWYLSSYTSNLWAYLDEGNFLHGCTYYWTVIAHDANTFGTYANEIWSFEADYSDHRYYPGWTLMSVPYVLSDDDPVEVMGDDIEGIWQLIGFDPAFGYVPNYPPVPPNEDPVPLELGQGYWLAIAHDEDVVLDMPAGSTTLDTDFTTDLALGWNMLGYPYLVGSSLWDWSFEHEGTTYTTFDAVMAGLLVPQIHVAAPEYGSWGYWFHFGATHWAKPWYGFWLLVLEEDVTLTIPHPGSGPAVAGGEGELDDAEASDWKLGLFARTGEEQYGAVHVGANEAATDGYDLRYDSPAPPLRPEMNSGELIYLERSTWDMEWGPEFACDIRAMFETGEQGFAITLGDYEEITLEWPLLESQLPDGYTAVLRDLDTGEEISLHEHTSWVRPGGSELELVVTASATRVEPGAGAELPARFELLPAYPNPFNPSTTLQFTLPKSGQVELKVYDIMGRQVAELLDGSMQAGEHSATWQAANLASGVYFVRLSLGSETAIQKVVLMK